MFNTAQKTVQKLSNMFKMLSKCEETFSSAKKSDWNIWATANDNFEGLKKENCGQRNFGNPIEKIG